VSLETGRNVIDMGGFMGSDPVPTLAKLKGLISSGQLHYVLLDGGTGGGARGGGFGGGPGGGASSAATTARNAWIKANGKLVTVSGSTSTGASLYYLA
jgi:hypothetical protein